MIQKPIAFIAVTALPIISMAQESKINEQPAKMALVAAKAPTTEPWTQPAEYALVRASDEPNYETVNMSVQWSKQYDVIKNPSRPEETREFHKVSVAPYWQQSTKEKKPVNDRGMTLGYVFQPPSACLDHERPDCMEWKFAGSVSAGRTKTELLTTPKTYTDATQLTAKASIALTHPKWSGGYHYFSMAAGAFRDQRNKPNALVPNGQETGLFVRPELVWLPSGLKRKDKAWAIEFKLAAQYQHGLDAGGARTRENHRWFKAQLALPLGEFGDGSDKWYPSIALQRQGGEDATTAELRRYESRLAFQLKVGK